MNTMEIMALQGAITRIKEMVWEDSQQPVKNLNHLLEAVEVFRVMDVSDIDALRRRVEQADKLAAELESQSIEVYYDEDMTPDELWEIIREREAKARTALAAYRE